MEEMGMTDMQYKDFLRGLVTDLERIQELNTGEAAGKEIEKLLERFRATIES